YHPNRWIDKIRYIPRLLISSIIKNPMMGKYEKDIIVLDHHRKVKVDHHYQDIYTNHFIQSLDPKEYVVLEEPYNRRHYTRFLDPTRKHTDIVNLHCIIQRIFHPIKLVESELNVL